MNGEAGFLGAGGEKAGAGAVGLPSDISFFDKDLDRPSCGFADNGGTLVGMTTVFIKLLPLMRIGKIVGSSEDLSVYQMTYHRTVMIEKPAVELLRKRVCLVAYPFRIVKPIRGKSSGCSVSMRKPESPSSRILTT